eukprot:TRINITY_DN5094_c0_g1_i1.p2 TRINITY_DN5094_c0_g1~~TRINITY_DN5094_c0_g1_i1.p2  ORF type:complete len:115 (-),score=11.17 TRINITY_DN5094_c0_g1_i1:251-595(-)
MSNGRYASACATVKTALAGNSGLLKRESSVNLKKSSSSASAWSCVLKASGLMARERIPEQKAWCALGAARWPATPTCPATQAEQNSCTHEGMVCTRRMMGRHTGAEERDPIIPA